MVREQERKSMILGLWTWRYADRRWMERSLPRGGVKRPPARCYISHHVSFVTRVWTGPSAPAKQHQIATMDSSTPTFAGLKGQPLVLAVTLTSGLGFLYDHMCPIVGMVQLR